MAGYQSHMKRLLHSSESPKDGIAPPANSNATDDPTEAKAVPRKFAVDSRKDATAMPARSLREISPSEATAHKYAATLARAKSSEVIRAYMTYELFRGKKIAVPKSRLGAGDPFLATAKNIRTVARFTAREIQTGV